jgi:hypothetical protein
MRLEKESPTSGNRERGKGFEGIKGITLSAKYSTWEALRRRTPRRGAIHLYPVEPMHVETLRACGFDPAYIGHGLYVVWELVPEEAKGVADA